LIVGTPVADEITASTSPAGQPTVTNQGDIIVAGGGGDMAIAGMGNDKVNGSRGNDELNGGAGNDIIKGGPGNDKLFGVGGNNKLLGGKGNDTLVGEYGIDLLKGGKGKDTFAFSADLGEHTIAGFRPGEDAIRFDKALFADYAAVKAAMSARDGSVLIDDGDGYVFLAKVRIQNLDADDFLFA
jgi:Ca2+-binding RTX toxin-like protein